MTIQQELVQDALLCLTNESANYDSHLRCAFADRKDTWLTLGNGARAWASHAASYLPKFYRTTDKRMTTADLLAFAAALADYYRDHLDECTPEERAAMCKRLFIA